ncbi:MAG TPA: Fe-S protein assembly co-chaperone HscB [Rhodocyclaceae bacterium]|nr:Fe-S protein assembly co-chaperone HscB [Rhodocyclaceae bacterium]
MNLSANYFELFGLPVRFALDKVALDKAYRDLQAQVHPDRFAHADAAEQRVSMQKATRANEAYNALRKPLSRARYFLELHGVDLGTESNTAMPAEFLIEQMEWREAVEEARLGGDHHELETLHRRVGSELDGRYAALGVLLDADSLPLSQGDSLRSQENRHDAALEVRKLMFLEKLLQDIDDAIAELDEKM